MKNWQITGLCAILTLGFLLIGGCINPLSVNTSPAATPTLQITDVAVPATPSPTTIATPTAKYMVGDIVWRNESNYDTDLHRSRGMIILQVNAQSYNYQYISKDDGDLLWSQIYPNTEIDTIVSFEGIYPRKVDQVLSITSQYPSRAAYEKTISEESCNLSSYCRI
jgi:hypothetical protein